MTAQCSLRVTIITDEMLTHSITLRLEDMSPERFLSPLLGLFIQAVAATLATPPDHVVVFNVQRDTDAPGGHILNVSLSVGQPPGPGGGPPFLPSEDLQERLYLNRSLLAAISAQRVLPFDDNICLREPCENYMRCVSVLRFDSSAPFIASSSVLFRPIHPVGGLRCRCPPGFTGDYCETEVDLCYSRPCGPHGHCRSREGGYTCLCRDGYTGEPSAGTVRAANHGGSPAGLTLWSKPKSRLMMGLPGSFQLQLHQTFLDPACCLTAACLGSQNEQPSVRCASPHTHTRSGTCTPAHIPTETV